MFYSDKHLRIIILLQRGFPSGSVIKNPPANAGDAGDTCSIPGSGRSPGEGNGNLHQYSCLGNPTDREAWWVTVHGVSESRTWLSAHTHTKMTFTTETVAENRAGIRKEAWGYETCTPQSPCSTREATAMRNPCNTTSAHPHLPQEEKSPCSNQDLLRPTEQNETKAQVFYFPVVNTVFLLGWIRMTLRIIQPNISGSCPYLGGKERFL